MVSPPPSLAAKGGNRELLPSLGQRPCLGALLPLTRVQNANGHPLHCIILWGQQLPVPGNSQQGLTFLSRMSTRLSVTLNSSASSCVCVWLWPPREGNEEQVFGLASPQGRIHLSCPSASSSLLSCGVCCLKFQLRLFSVVSSEAGGGAVCILKCWVETTGLVLSEWLKEVRCSCI